VSESRAAWAFHESNEVIRLRASKDGGRGGSRTKEAEGEEQDEEWRDEAHEKEKGKGEEGRTKVAGLDGWRCVRPRTCPGDVKDRIPGWPGC
jgi:hypothetical protein